MMKKVSVVIPAYNKADLTVKTVESVLNQTYENIEVIVVDDGSTDNTRQRLIPYADKIKYVYKENRGACSARNAGIRLATGEYIAILDCDDIYSPHKIKMSVDYLERNPDFGLVHTLAHSIDENGAILRTYSFYESRYIGWIAKRLLMNNFIYNSTVVVRKSCFGKVGLFDETIFMPADWDMWLRLAERYKVGYINLPLSSYRTSGKVSGSYILKHLEQSKRKELLVLEKAFRKNPGLATSFRNRAISNVYSRSAVRYLLINDFGKAKEELKLSIQKYIFNLKALFLLAVITILRNKSNLILNPIRSAIAMKSKLLNTIMLKKINL